MVLFAASSAAVSLCSERVAHFVIPFFSERVRATFSARSWELPLTTRSGMLTRTPQPLGGHGALQQLDGHGAALARVPRRYPMASLARSSFLIIFFFVFFHCNIVFITFLRVDPILQYSSIAAVDYTISTAIR